MTWLGGDKSHEISHRSLVNVVLLLEVRTIQCKNIMSFPVVSSLQQVIKLDVYFYLKFEHFSLSDSLIDISQTIDSWSKLLHLVDGLVMLYKCAKFQRESVMCTINLPAWFSGGLSLKIKYTVNSIFEPCYSPEPRVEVYGFRLNFNISKLAYWNFRILGIDLELACNWGSCGNVI